MKSDDLEFHVLACLSAAPLGKHGYIVNRWLKDRLDLNVPLPSIYRVIKRLHAQGLVDLQESGFLDSLAGLPRKIYRLSPAGWKYMAQRAAAVRIQAGRLQYSLTEYEKALSHGQEETQGG